MKFSKTATLEDRVRSLRQEIDQFIDERVEKLRAECPGVPGPMLRNSLTARSGGCECRALLNILEQS